MCSGAFTQEKRSFEQSSKCLRSRTASSVFWVSQMKKRPTWRRGLSNTVSAAAHRDLLSGVVLFWSSSGRQTHYLYICVFIIFLFFCFSGGGYLEVGDERCTHMVVEENSVKELPITPSKKVYVVKQEVSSFFGRVRLGCASKDKQV